MLKNNVGEVFTEYGKRLLNFIRTKVSRFEDAEDILQDVFYQFARVNDEVTDPIENTAAWLYRVSRNKITDYYRKKKDETLPTYHDEDDNEDVFEEIADILYGDDATPETELFRALLLEEIQNAIAHLPKEQREVFEMTELNGLSVKEIAKELNIPINTVLSRKHYAVKFLRKRLKGIYDDVMGS